ncbi:methyltransferase domain-containing protein [uncultured Imperialibacter sp.]|uniref:class I SAM-dependent methyltransferase n=1 Tax=Imperialibacter sp. TaxID=2038411 RepID=UPI0030DC7EE3|tara:strand:- start:2843 stop:3493 length:651 start_codon:yes stop_codon:yes gene_type:complete
MASKRYTPALGFASLSDWYDLAIKVTMPERRIRAKLVDHLVPEAGEHILEFGFGTGTNLLVAANRCSDCHLIGLDIDPKMREIAAKKLSRHSFNIPLELYDGGEFPFESGTFDKVYSCLVFHHLDKASKIWSMREIHRLLKPGGRFVLGDWGKAKTKTLRNAFYMVQFLDGFATTNDNVNGLIPEYLSSAGFSEVQEAEYINSMLGTFTYHVCSRT